MGAPISIGRRLRWLFGRTVGGSPAPAPPVASPPAEAGAGHTPLTTIPAPPQYAWAEEVHEQQLAALPTAGGREIVLVGDSLAQIWPLTTWTPWRAFSLGVGGDRTQHILWRLDRLKWGTCRPERILIVAGTNNLLAGDTAADIAAGVDAIAARLEALHPDATLFALLPPPLGADFGDGVAVKRELKALLVPRFRDRLIDADAAMLAEGQRPNSNYQDDHVHFTDRGYDVLTGVVRAVCQPST